MELIIEEISRGNKLIGRHKIKNTNNIKIGRGYDSDIILSDPHICPTHLTVSESNGAWIANDNNSVNGSFLSHHEPLDNNHEIQSGDVISLGKSQLRFLYPDHPVAESIEFSVFESIVDFTRKPVVIFFSLLFFIGMSAISFYLNAPSDILLSKLFMSAAGLTLGFAIFPSIYTVISHLTKHEARFLAHLGISFIIFNLFWLFDVAENILAFNLSSQWNGYGMSVLISAALIYALFWFNFFVGFHQSSKRRMVFSTYFTLAIVATATLVKMSSTPEFRIAPKYNATLMSPAFLIAPPSPIEEFVNDADGLFKQVDKKRESK